MRIDLLDLIEQILYWAGLAILTAAMVYAIASPHPSSLNHSAMYWTLITCGLVPFVVGGFTHFSGRGLKPNSSEKSSPKNPRAPRG